MKKFLKSRALQAAALSIACIGILAACLLAGRNREKPFQPEETPVESRASEWVEPQPATTPATTEPPAAAIPEKATEEILESYPQVAGESEEGTVIDLTPDASGLKENPPEPPVPQGDMGNPETPPTYEPEVPEPATSPDGNPGNGAVYDPVFGWGVPGEVVQSSMDSEGEPDKMVGNMGN